MFAFRHAVATLQHGVFVRQSNSGIHCRLPGVLLQFHQSCRSATPGLRICRKSSRSTTRPFPAGWPPPISRRSASTSGGNGLPSSTRRGGRYGSIAETAPPSRSHGSRCARSTDAPPTTQRSRCRSTRRRRPGATGSGDDCSITRCARRPRSASTRCSPSRSRTTRRASACSAPRAFAHGEGCRASPGSTACGATC